MVYHADTDNQPPHVQVILGDAFIPEGLETALRRSNVSASFRPLSDAVRDGRMPTADAFVVVPPEDSPPTADRLRVLFDRLADRPRATLVIDRSDGRMPRLSHPPTLPVSCCRGLDPVELAGRIAAMTSMCRSLDSLHRAACSSRRDDLSASQ